MRNLCRLDTVPEVPIPDLHHSPPPPPWRGGRFRLRRRGRTAIKAWVRSHLGLFPHRLHDGSPPPPPPPLPADVQQMLLVIGAPLVPRPVEPWKGMAGQDIADLPLEVSKAMYVVEQYVAAIGGAQAVTTAAGRMCAVGSVWMRMTKGHNKSAFKTGMVHGDVAGGGFVLWQKTPELWCVEMLVSGSSGAKMSAGSNGKVAWRQAPWQEARAAPGPPRPLRRCVQGLDPKATADLFSGAAWAGEKRFNGSDCFVLRVDAALPTLRARSRAVAEVLRHTLLGYFSQRTGLLVGLEDTHAVRVEGVRWETCLASSIGDYRRVDGVGVAHAGRTCATLTRVARGRKRMTRMEEAWSIEEVGFNVTGLCKECFLPPGDMVPCQPYEHVAPAAEKECIRDHCSSEKDAAAAAATASPNNAVGTARVDVVAAPEAMGDICGAVRPVVAARKVLVPAAVGLVCFGLVKVAALGTVDVAENAQEGCRAA